MPLALPRLQRRLILDLILALAVGVALRPVMALHPVWWLAWIAPAALLLLALRNEESRAGRLVGLAALVGSSVNFHYYAVVMPLGFALLATVGMALLWGLVVSVSRRAVLRWRAWWTVLVFPIVWVAVDTVMAAVLPDGNWASLAYTQSEVLPVLQRNRKVS